MCESGDTILIPSKPHFTIYGCLAGALDIKLQTLREREREHLLDILAVAKGKESTHYCR